MTVSPSGSTWQERNRISTPASLASCIAVPNSEWVCMLGEHWRIEREIRTRIKARFDREGIVMPHYSVPESDN